MQIVHENWRVKRLVLLFSIIVFLGAAFTTKVINANEARVDQLTFVNDEGEYSFKYPSKWILRQGSNGSYVRIENLITKEIRKNPDEYFKIEVVTLPKSLTISLSEWINRQNSTIPKPSILESHNIKVSGHEAVYQVEYYAEFQHTSSAVFVNGGDKVLIINFSSTSNKFKSVIDEFLVNFTIN